MSYLQSQETLCYIFVMQKHDNHVAAYYFRLSALDDLAKQRAYEDMLIGRLQRGEYLTKAAAKMARRYVRERKIKQH